MRPRMCAAVCLFTSLHHTHTLTHIVRQYKYRKECARSAAGKSHNGRKFVPSAIRVQIMCTQPTHTGHANIRIDTHAHSLASALRDSRVELSHCWRRAGRRAGRKRPPPRCTRQHSGRIRCVCISSVYYTFERRTLAMVLV